jgi:hypothetical protein
LSSLSFFIIISTILPATMLRYYSTSAYLMPSEIFSSSFRFIGSQLPIDRHSTSLRSTRYPWVPTDQAHCHPRQVGPAYQKTRRPDSGPNRPIVGSPHDLLKTFQKIPEKTLSGTTLRLSVQDKTIGGFRPSRSTDMASVVMS